MIHPAHLQLLAAARHDDLTRKADQARHAHAATRRPGTRGRLRAAVTRALQPLAAHRRTNPTPPATPEYPPAPYTPPVPTTVGGAS